MGAGILKLGESLIIDRLIANDLPVMRRNKVGAGLISLSAILFTIGLGFFIYGAYLWLGLHMTPDIAALYTATLVLALSLASAAGAYIFANYRKQKMHKMRKEITKAVTQTIEGADGELNTLIRENPGTAMLISTLAGYMIAEKAL